MIVQQGALEKLEHYFLPLTGRPKTCAYFYRFTGLSQEVSQFLRRYYAASRKNGVVADGRIPNPDARQLDYFSEMMGMEFRLEQAFLSERLGRWLPRMSQSQLEAVSGAVFATLMELRQQGKNDNMLRNAYIKYMCWFYYKFEPIMNRLGGDDLPKILYNGSVSGYELQLLTILSRVGADIVLLEREGDGPYLRLDPASRLSRLYQAGGLTPIPPDFTLKQVQAELAQEQNRQRLYGPPPDVEACTNAWMKKPELSAVLTGVQARGRDKHFFYNCFLAQYGVEDKLLFSSDLFDLYRRIKGEKRRVCVVSGRIPLPTPEEIGTIQRSNYTGMEQLAGGLAQNIRAGDPQLQRLMVKAFFDVVLAEGDQAKNSLSKLTNAAVYLLCWLKRYQKELFSGWTMPEVSVFILFGGCGTEHEARFLRLLAKLPVDVLMLQPNLSAGSCLSDPALLEVRYEYSLTMEAFPVEQAQTRVSTAAYQAERDLDSMMYQDTGMYRNQQYGKAESVTLQTTYEEIGILWDQELKFRPNFQVTDNAVTIPVILEKVCGVKYGKTDSYWLDIKKLITPDTLLISSIPWITPRDPNPMKACAAQFLQNGRLIKNRIKGHKAYPYGILRAEMQDYLLEKLQLLLDRQIIAGTGQNGAEYTTVAVALNLSKELLRLIQKFDFTKKNPKVVALCTGEEVLSLEDSILFAFLNLIGFDIVFFVPTGYQCIERYFQYPFANEQQVGEYLYDLSPPDFKTVQERGRNPLRKLFGRSH